MYLKKSDGPRVVNLPDGSILTRDDLPCESTKRWVASRKAIVAKAVMFGLIRRSDAMSRYDLSDEELSDWIDAVQRYGHEGLKITQIDQLRSSPLMKSPNFEGPHDAAEMAQLQTPRQMYTESGSKRRLR
jgi:hypothetical protein